MKWNKSYCKRYVYSFVPLRLWVLCLLFSFLVTTNGCNFAQQDTLDKIRNNTERSAIANETLVRIEGELNKNNEAIAKLVSTFENNIKNTEPAKPFEIPDWVKIISGLVLLLLAPDGLKKAGQGIGGTVSIIKKVIGKK